MAFKHLVVVRKVAGDKMNTNFGDNTRDRDGNDFWEYGVDICFFVDGHPVLVDSVSTYHHVRSLSIREY